MQVTISGTDGKCHPYIAVVKTKFKTNINQLINA